MNQLLLLISYAPVARWLEVGKGLHVSLALLALFFGLGALFLTSDETTPRGVSRFFGQANRASAERILVAGSALDGLPYLREVAQSRQIHLVGFINARSDGTVLVRSADGVHGYKDLGEALLENAIDELLLVSADALGEPASVASCCAERGITFHTIIDASLPKIGHRHTDLLANGERLVSVVSAPQSRVQLSIKRALDVIGALLGLALCSVAYLIYAARIRRETGGSVFFKQLRVGRNGRLFKCYKFRSMTVDAEFKQASFQSRSETGGAFIKIKDDPRITPTGKILRRRYIDELPQFLNVLKGDMSLVGPRPSQPVEVEKYQHHQFRRLSVKPGLTGLFQLQGHSVVTGFEDVVRLDCEYIDRWSLWLDLSIIGRTVRKLFAGDGW